MRMYVNCDWSSRFQKQITVRGKHGNEANNEARRQDPEHFSNLHWSDDDLLNNCGPNDCSIPQNLQRFVELSLKVQSVQTCRTQLQMDKTSIHAVV